MIPRALFLLLSLALAGCASAVKVDVQDARSKEIAARKTFAWVPAGDPKDSKLMPVLDGIRTDIEQGLIAKGYQKAAAEEADFHIAVGVKLGVESVTTMSRDNMIEEAWWAGGTGMGTSFTARTSAVTPELDAKLALLAGDRGLTAAPLWRGVASFKVLLDRPATEKGREAAAKLVKSFPKNKP